MKLLSEQDVTNNLLNRLEKDFILKKDLYVSTMTGDGLLKINPKIANTALTESLKILKSQYHLHVDSTIHNQIDASEFYTVIFDKNKDNDTQTQIRLLFPYGPMMADILCGALIQDSKKNLRQGEINLLLNQNKIDTADDIALHELFKIYRPQNQQLKTIPKKVIDSVNYKGLEKDPFNLVTTFTIKLNDVYKPLQTSIKTKNKHTNYNNIAPANIIFVAYDEKQDLVKFVTSLY